PESRVAPDPDDHPHLRFRRRRRRVSDDAGQGGRNHQTADHLLSDIRSTVEQNTRSPPAMNLALYLHNLLDKVTLQELEDLTALAEELDFDSVWTLDRIVVPEA